MIWNWFWHISVQAQRMMVMLNSWCINVQFQLVIECWPGYLWFPSQSSHTTSHRYQHPWAKLYWFHCRWCITCTALIIPWGERKCLRIINWRLGIQCLVASIQLCSRWWYLACGKDGPEWTWFLWIVTINNHFDFYGWLHSTTYSLGFLCKN